MVVEVAALIVESASAVAGMAREARRAKDGRSASAVVAALASLDHASALEAASSARVALMLRGAMTKSHVEIVARDVQTQRLLSQLMLALIVADQGEAKEKICRLMEHHVPTLISDVDEADAAYFATELAGLATEICEKTVERALQEAPESLISVQQLATMKRAHAILLRVSDQIDASERRQDAKYAESRAKFLAEYRVVCDEVHGMIKPPDFETNHRIPIEELYVPPTIQRLDSAHNQEVLEPDILKSLVDRTVVLGDPGGGKSTLSNFLTMRWARDTDAPIPFHVTLRDFVAFSDSLSVVQYIESQMPSRYQIHPVGGLIEDLLTSGNAIVVFDGLDELTDPTKRRAVTSAVETFAIRFPVARILVTSRKVGYEQARLDPAIFETYLISGFATAEIRSYVQKWFASQGLYTQGEAATLSTQFLAQSAAVKELASNPLMLSLMCIIFRGENFIPRNRPAIYEKCANLLFEKWDGHRQIEVPLKARDYVDAAMKHMAYVYLSTGVGESGIPRAHLVREMTTYLYPRAIETVEAAERAAEEFVDFCAGRAWVFSDAGTTASGEPIFTFTHRTFMEYFAAVHLIRITGTPEKLARELLPRIAREEWDVVAQLAVQQVDKPHDRGTERALRVMLEDKRKRSNSNRSRILQFVVRCSEFAIVAPLFLRQLSDTCLNFFLTTYSSEMGYRADSLRPLLDLQEVAPEESLEPIIESHRAVLLDRIPQGASVETDNALYLLLLGLIRRFNGRVWRKDSKSNVWNSLFRETAGALLPSLKVLAISNPRIYIPLMVGGVISVRQAVDQMHRANLSFHQIYFEMPSIGGNDLGGSVVEMVLAPISRDLAEARDGDIVKEVVASFLSDFWSASVNRGSVGESVQRGLMERERSDLLAIENSEGILDFVVISLLAFDEHDRLVVPSRGPGDGADLEAIEASVMSVEVRDFYNEWAAGRSRVFEESTQVVVVP